MPSCLNPEVCISLEVIRGATQAEHIQQVASSARSLTGFPTDLYSPLHLETSLLLSLLPLHEISDRKSMQGTPTSLSDLNSFVYQFLSFKKFSLSNVEPAYILILQFLFPFSSPAATTNPMGVAWKADQPRCLQQYSEMIHSSHFCMVPTCDWLRLYVLYYAFLFHIF